MARPIRLFTGKLIDPTDPRPDVVDIVDIAWHLSICNRFAGATRWPYSVNQHSRAISGLCSPQNAPHGLVHDAPEAFLHDVTAPLKEDDRMEAYRELEEAWWQAIAVALNLNPRMPAEVIEIDKAFSHIEARHLLNGGMGRPAPKCAPVDQFGEQAFEAVCEDENQQASFVSFLCVWYTLNADSEPRRK